MDPIAVLQNRIEQLEARLGLAANAPVPQEIPDDGLPAESYPSQQGDGAVPNKMMNLAANLLQAAETVQNATAGHEKLNQAMNMASELNNYTDPGQVENMQQNQQNMQEVAAADPAIRQYCQCMHHCQRDGGSYRRTGKIEGKPSLQLASKCRIIQSDNVVADVKVYKIPEKTAPVMNSEPIQQVPQMQAQVNNLHMAAAEAKGQADQVLQGVQELAQTCGSAAQQASEHIAEIAQKVEQAEEKKFPKRRNGLD